MTLFLALLIGFFSGLRSLTAPAATAWAAYLGWLTENWRQVFFILTLEFVL